MHCSSVARPERALVGTHVITAAFAIRLLAPLLLVIAVVPVRSGYLPVYVCMHYLLATGDQNPSWGPIPMQDTTVTVLGYP